MDLQKELAQKKDEVQTLIVERESIQFCSGWQQLTSSPILRSGPWAVEWIFSFSPIIQEMGVPGDETFCPKKDVQGGWRIYIESFSCLEWLKGIFAWMCVSLNQTFCSVGRGSVMVEVLVVKL